MPAALVPGSSAPSQVTELGHGHMTCPAHCTGCCCNAVVGGVEASKPTKHHGRSGSASFTSAPYSLDAHQPRVLQMFMVKFCKRKQTEILRHWSLGEAPLPTKTAGTGGQLSSNHLWIPMFSCGLTHIIINRNIFEMINSKIL